MDIFELKKEQLKLAPKIVLNDGFSKIKTIAGVDCCPFENKLIACVVICEYPSLKMLEKKTFILDGPLPYKPGYLAYREMPAMIEAFNKLEEEPDILFVDGLGILHPRRIGLASHLGLVLNQPTIGITDKLLFGKVENGKIIYNNHVSGFEIKTKEHAKSIYVSPGHFITLGSTLNIITNAIKFPHKMPEPLYLAHKFAKKKAKAL